MEKSNNSIYDASNKSVSAVKELKDLKKVKSKIEALDLSQNMLVTFKGLDGFSKLKVLNMDNNFIVSLDTLPSLGKLDALSLNYNRLNDLGNICKYVVKKCPKLLHISLLKNPINPHTEGEDKYEKFRDTVHRAIKTLQSLDGSNFEGSKVVLPGILAGKSSDLETVLEDPNSKAAKYDPSSKGEDKRVKSKTMTMTAGKGTGKLSYNHKAYKKYNSEKSLADRILKSNSEGNRFIKNNDL